MVTGFLLYLEGAEFRLELSCNDEDSGVTSFEEDLKGLYEHIGFRYIIIS